MANPNLLLENQQGPLELEDKKSPLQLEPLATTGNLVDHIFQFADFATALSDPTVGPTFNAPLITGFPNKEVLVYSNTTINSVNAEIGFWFIVTAFGLISAFQNHPQIRIINDLTAMCAGQTSVLLFNLPDVLIAEDGTTVLIAEDNMNLLVRELDATVSDPTFTNIVVSNYGLYCTGLATAPNGVLANDANTAFLVNDAKTSFLTVN